MTSTGGHETDDMGQAATWSATGAAALEAPSRVVDQGNARSLEAFFRSEYSRVWRWVQRMGVPASEADDVAQEVFLVAFRRPPRELTRAWIYQVTRRVCSHYRRSRGRAAQRGQDLEWVPPAASKAEQPELVARRERAHRFALFLRELPDEQREPFELVVLEGISPTEVAELIGAPRNTIYTRLRRARERLTQWLDEEQRHEG